MAFPYFAPLSPWIVDIMKNRENNPILSSTRNPFVILTSGALVVKGSASDKFEDRKTELVKMIKDTPSKDSYKGCIISNNVNNIDLSYSNAETIVGIDFEGKYIKVQGETGRKISTPLIESLDIDTDGANNTLKTATVTVRLFSLKQLEMFELFYMKPGMNILVEFGDGSLFQIDKNVRTAKFDAYKSGEKVNFTPFSKVDDALVPKESYQNFYEGFSDYFRSSTDAFAKYVNKLQRSLGTYDLVAGKVLGYNFTIEADGTYLATIEISQGNQVSLAIPLKPKKDNTNVQAQNLKNTPTNEEQLIEILASDLNIDRDKLNDLINATPHTETGDKKNWLKKEFFNFFKINTTNRETTASDKRYVSLRFILKILLNYIVNDGGVDKDYFTLSIPTYKIGNKEKEVIPVQSNKFIISSNQDIIFPTNELPEFKSKDGKIIINKEKNSKTVDGRINDYDFHIVGELQEVFNGIKIDSQIGDARTGNALNIFVNYEQIVKLWNRSYTRIEFLEKVLEIVNKNSYGLFALIFGLREENSGPAVIDYKFKNKLNTLSTETYRFKPTTIKSIVRDFSFNFEMSNLVAGRTIFNSGKFLAEAKTEDANKVIKAEEKLIELPEMAFKSIDNSSLGNADGWYSINRIELERILKDVKSKKEIPKTSSEEIKEDDDDDVTTVADDFTKIIESKSIKYEMDTSGKKIQTLVFEDRNIVQNQIKQEPANTKKPTLSPIDITLTIDGFSGFRCGQYFNVDGIPEIYNQIGVFQITNTKHNIDNDGWKTTIEAGWNLAPKT